MQIVDSKENETEVGVEQTVVIKRLKNGTIQVEAKGMTSEELLSMFSSAHDNLVLDIATNRSLGILATYLDNVQKNAEILGIMRGPVQYGSKPS